MITPAQVPPNPATPQRPPGVQAVARPMAPVNRRAPMAAPNTPNVTPSPAAGVSPLPQTGAAPTPAPVPAAPQPNYASVTPINPQADLRGQQIAPGETPDRLAFANQRFDQFMSDSAPQVEAQRRDLLKNGAAMGRVGSGMLRTSFGDLASELNRQATNERSRLFTNAAEGSIGDQQNNRAELRGERDYQVGQEASAFNRGRQERFDQEDLLNSGFNRDVTRAQIGFQGNPSGAVGAVAANQQDRAGQAMSTFQDLMAGNGAAGAATPPISDAPTFQNLPQLPKVGQIPQGVPPIRPVSLPTL